MQEKESLLGQDYEGHEGHFGVDTLPSRGRGPKAVRAGMAGERKRGLGFVAKIWLAIVMTAAAATGLILLLMSGAFGGCQHHQDHDALQLSVEGGLGVSHVPPSSQVDGLGPVNVAGLARRQSSSAPATTTATSSATATSASSSATVLVDFQVHQPVLTPEGATLDSGESNGDAGDVEDSCQVLLMDYVFAYSYGEPFIGKSQTITPL